MDNSESETLVLERPIDGLPLTNLPVIRTELKRTCSHYWLIDKANGPLSHAVCKFCREERDFNNSPFEFYITGIRERIETKVR